jgi:hypothetical protein
MTLFLKRSTKRSRRAINESWSVAGMVTVENAPTSA